MGARIDGCIACAPLAAITLKSFLTRACNHHTSYLEVHVPCSLVRTLVSGSSYFAALGSPSRLVADLFTKSVTSTRA